MAHTDPLIPQLVMQRDHLDDLPDVLLPAGYTLRPSREGDGHYWALILNETFGGARTTESFLNDMVRHPAYRADRIFFVCDPGGLPCATASAYRQERWGAQTGYVHYVAVRPAHQGLKLGYWVSLAVMHQFRTEGCRNAVLETDDFRLPAIKTYLRLGFRPLIVHENQPARWQRIFAVLGVGACTDEPLTT